jgi:hypothetical protein
MLDELSHTSTGDLPLTVCPADRLGLRRCVCGTVRAVWWFAWHLPSAGAARIWAGHSSHDHPSLTRPKREPFTVFFFEMATLGAETARYAMGARVQVLWEGELYTPEVTQCHDAGEYDVGTRR